MQTLLFLFALQHLVFIADKIAYYLFISIFCLGCACVEGEVNPMPMIDGGSMTDYDPIGNRAVSFYYEKWISEDRALAERGTFAEQRAQE